MKRYLIFAALVPLLGGFLLLLATTVTSGYWSHPPSMSEAGKLVIVFVRTLQYSYLFGILPALMLGAVDDIILHVKRIGPVVRLLIVGLIGAAVSELLYGSRGSDSGVLQFVLYGLVGFVPGTVSSGVAHYFVNCPATA
jgi:nitrogen fixation/metabolism regulation signal transduction histidine kinase